MKTIMIIDDEPLIRRGLESMIPWKKMECRLLGHAVNGEEGLLKIREWKPDIVFTDIKMPKMDGITMMQEVLKEPNPPVFVVLSGYDDFKLVRSAMRLGAIDYLTKLDLEEEELIRVVSEAARRAGENNKEYQPQDRAFSDFKENILRELLQLSTDQEFYQKMQPSSFALKEGFFYRLLCLKLPGFPDEKCKQGTLSGAFLTNICKEQIPKEIEVFEYHIHEDVSVLYLESYGIIDRDMLAMQCKAMEEDIKKYLNQEILMGVSRSHHNVFHLPDALEEAMQSMAFHIGGAQSTIHFYMDLLNVHFLEKQIERLNQEPDFLEAVENYILLLQKFVMHQTDSQEGIRLCCRLIQRIYEWDVNSKEFFMRWYGKEYYEIQDFNGVISKGGLSTWLLRLQQGLTGYGQHCIGEIYRYKVKKAKQYIKDNRFQKISLNEVSQELEITPSYLSRIFKKVTQQSFSDYIAAVKMEEAKKLLLQDNNRIYEVSTKLGYDDPYYFSKVFKRVTQMTPSEYIARH